MPQNIDLQIFWLTHVKSPPCDFVAPGTSDGAQEEEIKALFNMIDKDKSGSLSERVVFLSNRNVENFENGDKHTISR